MSSDKIQRLHNITASGTYGNLINTPLHPEVKKLYDAPHLAVFINGDWLPIIPGMIIGIIKDRTKVDGVAPYILAKVNAKPLAEYIDLVAWSTDTKTTRKLRLGAKYGGSYASGVRDADQVIDATMAALKGPPSE